MGVTWIDSHRFGAAAESYADIVLADSPFSFWMLNETVGTSASDQGSAGHPASLLNTPTLGDTGPSAAIPNAMSFVSASSENAETANTSNYNHASSGNWTIECWLKYSTVGTTVQTPVAWRLNGVGVENKDTTGIITVNNGVSGRIQAIAPSTVTNNSIFTVNSDGGWNDGIWHHVVAQATSGGALDLWIDGVERATDSTARNTSTNGGGSGRLVTMACNFTSSRIQYFSGSLAAVAVYKTALPDARIVDHYTAGA